MVATISDPTALLELRGASARRRAELSGSTHPAMGGGGGAVGGGGGAAGGGGGRRSCDGDEHSDDDGAAGNAFNGEREVVSQSERTALMLLFSLSRLSSRVFSSSMEK